MRRSSEDLPAFGNPRSAASARSFRRSSIDHSSPGHPTSAIRGACCVGRAKRLLPAPPGPPRATTARAPGCARSTSRLPSSSSTCVPTGTATSTVPPLAPCLFFPCPCTPRPPSKRRLRWKNERSRRSGSATRTTSPPFPPSPPSGPPFGTYFSRRKLSEPSPPRPPRTSMRARSWNTGRSLDDADDAAGAVRLERDLAVARREDRVVAPETGSRSGAEARAALADDDHSRLDVLAIEDLDAESLGFGVAAVLRGAESFLVGHT